LQPSEHGRLQAFGILRSARYGVRQNDLRPVRFGAPNGVCAAVGRYVREFGPRCIEHLSYAIDGVGIDKCSFTRTSAMRTPRGPAVESEKRA
jgi:hypothetical protein